MNNKAENTTTVLQRAVNSAIDSGSSRELYLRVNDVDHWYKDDTALIRLCSANSNSAHWVSLDTFFGAFSLTTWCGEANLDSITIKATFAGSAIMRVWHQDITGPRRLIAEAYLEDSKTDTVLEYIEGLRGQTGILYPAFYVIGSTFCLDSVSYSTSQPPPRSVSVAIVTPTFRRESYIKKNIEIFESLTRDSLTNNLKLIIVDNAGSLAHSDGPNLHIYKNKNLGGSGGFARGIAEISMNHPDVTHVLFADDDLIFEGESILRAATLAAFLPENCIIPGGMLEVGNPNRLHEIGARVKGFYFTSVKGGLELSRPDHVLKYDVAEHMTFAGWWFVMYPLNILKNTYPAPFFVGWDDVLHGKMNSSYKKVTLTGVAVWHEEFSRKDVNWRWYYHSRNGFITNFVDGKCPIKHHFRHVMKSLLTYRYERAEYLLDGADDALKGPVFLDQIEMDQFHEILVAKQQQKLTKIEKNKLKSDGFSVPKHPSRFKRALCRITLNGHLLPKSVFRSGSRDTYNVVLPLHSFQRSAIFRKNEVLYYEPTLNLGILCRIDRKRFFSLLLRTFLQVLDLKKKHSSEAKRWQASISELTSEATWMKKFTL